MRDRPFASGSEAPRVFGDVLAERRGGASRVLDAAEELEAQARDEPDGQRRRALQLQAEALRAAITENQRR